MSQLLNTMQFHCAAGSLRFHSSCTFNKKILSEHHKMILFPFALLWWTGDYAELFSAVLCRKWIFIGQHRGIIERKMVRSTTGLNLFFSWVPTAIRIRVVTCFPINMWVPCRTSAASLIMKRCQNKKVNKHVLKIIITIPMNYYLHLLRFPVYVHYLGNNTTQVSKKKCTLQ